jgi:predicted phage terminase large subunit-like protein
MQVSSVAAIDAELRRRERLATLEEEIRRRERALELADEARRSLRAFLPLAWETIEPGTPFVGNWHIDAICDHLEALARREVRTMLIEMPPRMLKSRLVSVAFPAWMWANDPTWRSMFGSYSSDLADESSMYCRSIIESDWYQTAYARPGGWGLRDDFNRVDEFLTTRGGARVATAPKGKSTGKGAHLVCADDPISVVEVFSKATREERARWWLKAMQSRLNDPKTGSILMVMQRLHVEDPAGAWLATGDVDVRLNLPMRYNARKTFSFGLGFTDPRTTDGELLHPERFGPKEVESLAKKLGSDSAAQLDQNPELTAGNLFKRTHFRFWRPDGFDPGTAGRPEGCTELPARVVPVRTVNGRVRPDFEEVLISLDANFKGKNAGNDPCGFTVWGCLGAGRFLMYAGWLHDGFNAACDEMRRLALVYPEAYTKLIEEAANGFAIVESLQDDRDPSKPPLSGVVVVKPDGGKEARAHAAEPQVAAGDVYLLEGAAWLQRYVDEMAVFPKGAHDDIVDSTTQALNHLRDRSLAALRALAAW